MNHCEKYEDLCSAMLDHALTAQEQDELNTHLAMCPSCRAYLEELQQMRALWKELEIPVPEELHEKMMGAIEAEIQKTIVQTPHKQRRRPPVFTMLAAAAACVMLAVSGQLTGLFGQMFSVPLQAASHREDAPSTANVTVPPTTLEDTAIQTAPKPEQHTVKKSAPKPEPVKPRAKQNVTTEKPQSPKESTEKQSEPAVPQSDVKYIVPENTPQTASIPQTADEGNIIDTMEDSETSRELMRAAEPSQAATYALVGGLPEELSQMQFARCYDVTGGTEIPVLDTMTLLVTADGISYYSVENNESKIGQVQQELKNSGYTLTLNETSGVSIQRSAKTILLIVHMA